MKDIVLSFDMDFTLIDNREGIINSFKYALQKKNLPDMDDLELERTIGMPLTEVFSQITCHSQKCSKYFCFPC